jgi:hypothetical protein
MDGTGSALAGAAVALHRKVGAPPVDRLADTAGLAKATLYDLLYGRRRARWSTVVRFVRACRSYAPSDVDESLFDLRRWRRLHDAEPAPPPAPRRHLVGAVPERVACFQQRHVTGFDDAAPPPDPDPGPVPTRGGAPRCHVLSGMGGVGKTQLAADVAGRLWESGAITVLVWVTGASRDAVVAGYAEAFSRITGFAADDEPAAAGRFLDWLAASGERWLVVIDDLTAPGDLRGLWPPSTSAGRTIVTTRRRDSALGGPGRALLEIHEFTAGQSRSYLGQKLGPLGLDAGAERLADALGHLPLALAQAAAYQIDRELPCTAYLERLAAGTLGDLTPEPKALPDGQPENVVATWDLSVELADSLHPRGLARPLLGLLSLLDSHGVPRALAGTAAVTGHLRAGPADALDALHCLRRLSLISLTAGEIVLHSVVHRATRERLSPRHRIPAARAAADGLLELWPAAEPGPPRLRANATALIGWSAELLCGGPVHPLIHRAGASLGESGDIASAIGHFRRLHDVAARLLGPGHRDVLHLRHEHMYWLGSSGDRAAAARMCETLAEDCGRLLGADDPLTLTTRLYRARWAGLAGDPGRAVDELTVLAGDMTRALTAAHPDTLTARTDLAHFRGQGGDPAGAAEACRRIVADRARILGPGHPHTLLARNDLAFWIWRSGDPGAAVPAFAALVDDCSRILGDEHRYTLGARGNLARCRGESGDPAAAVAGLAQVLAAATRALGPDHPITTRTATYLREWDHAG